MQPTEYHQKIIQYYKETENAYKDSWDLDNSLSIHFGYWDSTVKTFPESLRKMNEVMMIAGMVLPSDRVLDAGCGVGGGAIFLASMLGCRVTGISLSERQVEKARSIAREKKIDGLVDFTVLDYCDTGFPDASYDVIWACESICYADNKERFIKEAFRLLRPGGRLVVADGFVTSFANNDHPVIRQWLDGWQVNYLETPARFQQFMKESGFEKMQFRDITKQASHSSRRLNRFYWLANLYLLWKKINFSKPATEMQVKNIKACKFQYRGMKKGLWQYGLIVGTKKGIGNGQ